MSDDVAAVRFQLPQGAKLARRFHRDHTVQVLILTLILLILIMQSQILILILILFFPADDI